MPDQDASFNEVLGVSINTDGFSSGLDALTTLYTDWLSNLADKGLDGSQIINAGSLTGVQQQLSVLSTQFEAVQKAMTGLSEAIIDSFDKAGDSATGMADKSKSAAAILLETNKLIATQVVDAWVASNNEVYQSLIERVTKQEATLKEDAAMQEALVQQIAEENDINNEKQLQSIRDLVSQRIAMLNRAADEESRIAERNAAQAEAANTKQLAQEEKIQTQLIADGQKYYESSVAQQEELLNIKNQFLEKASEAQEAARVKSAEADQRYADQQAALSEKIADQQVAAAEKAAAQIQAIQEKRDYESYVAKGEGVESKFSASGRGSNVVNTLINGGDIGDLAKGIGSSVLGLAAFQLEFAAATAAIQAAISPITLFISTLKDGFSYLEQFQQRSSVVKEVLLNTEQFSANYGDNLKIAGEQADNLLKKVDDLAIKLNVKSEVIQNGLTNFLEAGGRNLVQNNDQAVQLSGLVAGALQTQNPNIDARTIRTEFQKFVQGASTDSDKLTIALGLTGDQMKAIVNHAKDYQDLLTQLIAVAPGLTERIADAGDREGALVSTLELYKERWDALVAGPAFAQLTQILQDILKYLNQNKDAVDEIGNALGAMVGQAARFAETLIKQDWSSLVGTFATLAKLIAGMAASINFMVAGANAIKELGSGVVNAAAFKAGSDQADTQRILDTNQLGQPEADKRFNSTMTGLRTRLQSKDPSQIFSEFEKNIGDANTALLRFNSSVDAVVNPKGRPKASNTFDATNPFAGGNLESAVGNPDVIGSLGEPPSKSTRGINTKAPSGSTMATDYENQIAQLRTGFDAAINDQKQQLASGQQNLQQYTQNVLDYLNMEKQAVADLTKQYQAKEQASGVKGADGKSTGLNTKGLELERTIGNQITQITDANNKDIVASARAKYQELNALSVAYANTELQRLKDSGASAVEIAQQTIQVHADEFRSRLAAIGGQIGGATTDAQRTQLQGQAGVLVAGNQAQQSKDDAALKLAQTKALNEQLNAEIAANDTLLKQSQDQYNQDIEAAKIGASNHLSESALYQEKIALDKQVLAIAEANLEIENQRLLTLKDIDGAEDSDLSRAGVASAQKAVGTATRNLSKAQGQVNVDSRTVDPESNARVEQIVFGDDDLKKLSDVFTQGFSTGVEDLTNVFKYADDIFKTYEAGFKSGNVLGGIGAVLSSGAGKQLGQVLGNTGGSLNKLAADGGALSGLDNATSGAVSGLGDFLGAASPFISAIGPAFQLIGSLFTQAAKDTAAEMQKEFQAIQLSYGSGAINLSEAIQQEQATISTTISKLSGEKGGQGELDAILPGMQQSLDALQEQQKQLFTQMDQAVGGLKLQQTYLESALNTWNSINQQVTQYVQAGGSLQEAAQYLSLSLEQQKQQAANDLIQAEAQGVQDAQNYNNLIIQRTQLIQQYNEKAFGIMNADSIERKQSLAVTANGQLQQQTVGFQQSLDSDNQQIDQLGQKVAAEQQIFGIASDTADLQTESNNLALASLQEQVQQWQAIEAIYNGIVQDSNGNYTYTSGLASQLGFTDGFGNSPTGNYNGTNPTLPGYAGPGTGNVNPPGIIGSSVLSNINNYTPTSFGAPNSGTSTGVNIGDIQVNITSSGGTIDADSIANDLQSAIVQRTQYAASSYYS